MFSSELSVWSLFLVIHLAINTAAATSAICYFPDGSVAKDHKSCSNINSPSACCEDGSICMTNGFCLDQMMVSRHSCTDRTWQDRACPLTGDCCQLTKWNDMTKGLVPCPGNNWSCNFQKCGTRHFSLTIGDLVPRASQLPHDVSLPVTIQVEASIGSEINTATTVTSATSSPILKPSCPTTHTDINKMGSRTATTVGVAVGVPLAMLAAALAVLLFFEKRKIRVVVDGSSKKDVMSLVETIVRNQALYEFQAGDAMIKPTMTSAVNGIHEKEEHRGGPRSRGQILEADVGVRDGRVELG